MEQQLEIITLNNLLEGKYMGLATTESAIQAVLNSAVRTHSNEFYVGTDVKEWLSSFEPLDEIDWIALFSKDNEEGHVIKNSHLEHTFTVLSHDNSYNWGGILMLILILGYYKMKMKNVMHMLGYTLERM